MVPVPLQLREPDVLKLEAICRQHGIILLTVRSYGLMGMLRVRAWGLWCSVKGLTRALSIFWLRVCSVKNLTREKCIPVGSSILHA